MSSLYTFTFVWNHHHRHHQSPASNITHFTPSRTYTPFLPHTLTNVVVVVDVLSSVSFICPRLSQRQTKLETFLLLFTFGTITNRAVTVFLFVLVLMFRHHSLQKFFMPICPTVNKVVMCYQALVKKPKLTIFVQSPTTNFCERKKMDLGDRSHFFAQR